MHTARRSSLESLSPRERLRSCALVSSFARSRRSRLTERGALSALTNLFCEHLFDFGPSTYTQTLRSVRPGGGESGGLCSVNSEGAHGLTGSQGANGLTGSNLDVAGPLFVVADVLTTGHQDATSST